MPLQNSGVGGFPPAPQHTAKAAAAADGGANKEQTQQSNANSLKEQYTKLVNKFTTNEWELSVLATSGGGDSNGNGSGGVVDPNVRQKEYLEKTIEGLKRALRKDSEKHRTTNMRILNEGVELCNEKSVTFTHCVAERARQTTSLMLARHARLVSYVFSFRISALQVFSAMQSKSVLLKLRLQMCNCNTFFL